MVSVSYRIVRPIFRTITDYANALIVGQTMRAVTDSLLISREKLSFIVDATSAPIASLAPISSWIGFEIGLIADALSNLEADGEDISCYDSSSFLIFIKTIPSRFYPFFILVIQFMLIGENARKNTENYQGCVE